MLKRTVSMSVLAGALAICAGPLFAADQARTQDRDQTQDRDRDQAQDQDRDRVYGSQLMTQEERNEYHARMRAAKTEEQRERIRDEHHERMKERAKERGVTLPETPPARGGMGPGGGMGPRGGGMGPGGGMRGERPY